MKPLTKGTFYNLPDVYPTPHNYMIYAILNFVCANLYWGGPFELNSTNWGEVI